MCGTEMYATDGRDEPSLHQAVSSTTTAPSTDTERGWSSPYPPRHSSGVEVHDGRVDGPGGVRRLER